MLLAPPLPQSSEKYVTWSPCIGASAALMLSQAQHACGGLLVAITPDSASAHALARELRVFISDTVTVEVFPDWEILPYDHFSPHQDIISQRLRALHRLTEQSAGIYLVPMATLLHRLMPPSHLAGHFFQLSAGQAFCPQSMAKRLVSSGYLAVAQVMAPGEFCIRGGLMDIFPMGSGHPFRVELFGEEIDSLRWFDPDTQRTHAQADHITILPAREFPTDEPAIELFRTQWRAEFEGAAQDCPVYEAVSKGTLPPGIEYYLPLFFDETATFFDYLPADCHIVLVNALHDAGEKFWEEVSARYEQLRHDISRPILAPIQVLLPVERVFEQFKRFKQIRLHTLPEPQAAISPLPDVSLDNRSTQPLGKLIAFLDAHPDKQILICAETAGRREVLLPLLKQANLSPTLCDNWQAFLNSPARLNILVASLDAGFIDTEKNLVIVAEAQLYGHQVMQRRRRQTSPAADPDRAIEDLATLRIGAPVVHYEYGIGQYLGLSTLSMGQVSGEFVVLLYANDDKIYVPVASLHLLSRYSGADLETVTYSRLGTDQWEKTKRKAAEKIRDVAAELLDIYARRAAKSGHAFALTDQDYHAFAGAFPFEETPDQRSAINQVVADMRAPSPMDRLVCGDVGFGKTEVAMRAAFVAVQAGKQVAMLVPTTLLAQQHAQTFQDRFADWPVNIALLSRFQTSKEAKTVLAKLEKGNIDIIIGTHKLLQDNIGFHNLGLVIIDEEHRFGVRQKEKLKALRTEVDFLTLTATPIPRTLNMALSAVRDLSIIATPPAKRLSIKTFVRQYDKPLIREAILRELMRGGQVYYLHNDVATMESCVNTLQEIVPEANIQFAHGQMPERQLERMMSDFYHQRFNVLVCTTIIETGIDIPTANTIILERADKLGLAQLHQLRGRVGRSHHQAYAYCLTPLPKSMTADAVKRLEALASLEDLGAGFSLATHDLEIRGAGDFLGEEQSGNMQAIGFSLYMALLERAVEALKNGEPYQLDTPLYMGAEIDCQVPALIPEEYVGDIDTRLILYKRMANANDEQALSDLQVEFIDRFGLLPPALENLFAVTRLKLKAQALGIQTIKAGDTSIRIVFSAQPTINVERLMVMIQLNPRAYRLKGTEQLTVTGDFSSIEQRFRTVDNVLTELS